MRVDNSREFFDNIPYSEQVGNGMLVTGDCRNVMTQMADESIDLVITDPPYNYEFIGREWDHDEIRRRLGRVQNVNASTLVKHVPYGSGLAGGVRNGRWYEKNRKNSEDYGAWCHSWAEHLFRVCKPGAYVAVFNSTRFLARVQIALEDSGFYPRDIIVMQKSGGIPKGLNAVGALTKAGSENPEEYVGYHSAMRNEWEGVVLVQKPLKNNYLTTLKEHGTGLMHAEIDGEGFRSNVVPRVSQREKRFPGVDELHATPKPEAWLDYLIDLLCPPSSDSVVLDPFIGTGTTAVAAQKAGKKWIGIDLIPEYVGLAKERIQFGMNERESKPNLLF